MSLQPACSKHSFDQGVANFFIDNFSFAALPNAPQIRNSDFVIENVIPGDFTYDGKLDVLVMGRKNPSSATDEILIRLYKGNGNDTIGKIMFVKYLRMYVQRSNWLLYGMQIPNTLIYRLRK